MQPSPTMKRRARDEWIVDVCALGLAVAWAAAGIVCGACQ